MGGGRTEATAGGRFLKSSRTVKCSFGDLPSGAGATVTIKVTPTAAGTLTNTASVTSGTSDPNTSNNSASATTTVDP